MEKTEMRQTAITRIKTSIRCLRDAPDSFSRGIEYGQASGVLYFAAETGLISSLEKERFLNGITSASEKARIAEKGVA